MYRSLQAGARICRVASAAGHPRRRRRRAQVGRRQRRRVLRRALRCNALPLGRLLIATALPVGAKARRCFGEAISQGCASNYTTPAHLGLPRRLVNPCRVCATAALTACRRPAMAGPSKCHPPTPDRSSRHVITSGMAKTASGGSYCSMAEFKDSLARQRGGAPHACLGGSEAVLVGPSAQCLTP